MAYIQTFNTATGVTTSVINSTKVNIVSNVAVYAAINTSATTGNTVVPPNVKFPFNMQGIGNTLGLLPVAGTAAITVTQVGNVAASGTAPVTANNSWQANVAAW
jgi:hypothetical protein